MGIVGLVAWEMETKTTTTVVHVVVDRPMSNTLFRHSSLMPTLDPIRERGEGSSYHNKPIPPDLNPDIQKPPVHMKKPLKNHPTVPPKLGGTIGWF